MKTRTLHKALSMLLTAAMVMNMGLTPVFATEGVTPPGISDVCTHHTEHKEDCGYKQGAPCNHEHTEDCTTQELICAITVDDTTGDAPEVATDSDAVVDSGNVSADAPHTHGEDCYTKTDNCKHIHDDTCGYTPDSPCTFDAASCTECKSSDKPAEKVCTCQPVDSGAQIHGQNCPLYTAPELSEAVKALIALVDPLPEADTITDENREDVRSTVDAAQTAYEALSGDDKAAFEATEQYKKLMALRDLQGLFENRNFAYATDTAGTSGWLEAGATYTKGSYDCIVFSSDANSAVILCVDKQPYAVDKAAAIATCISNGGRLTTFDEFVCIVLAKSLVSSIENYYCYEYERCWYTEYGPGYDNRIETISQSYFIAFDINRNLITPKEDFVPQKIYDASAFTVAMDNFTWLGVETPTITYYVDENGTKTTPENSGAADEGAAPVNVGDYFIKLSTEAVVVDGVTYEPSNSDYIPIGILDGVPVKITAQPEPTSAVYGYSVGTAPVLSLTASPTDGISEVSYQWYSVGTGAGNTDEKISGATQASYTVPVGLDVGAYSYYCAASCIGYPVRSDTATVTITTANSALELSTNKSDNTFTYGDTITFTANVSIPATKARAAAVNTVDFYCGITKLNDSPITLTESGGTGTATFTYNTTSKKIPAGEDIEITAGYSGSGNLNGVTQTVNVTLNKKPLTGGTITPGQSKPYDGNNSFSGIAATFAPANGVLDGDAVTATIGGTTSSSAVGTSLPLTVTSATLGAADAGFYLPPTDLSTFTGKSVAITKITPTITVETDKSSLMAGKDIMVTVKITNPARVESGFPEAGEITITPTNATLKTALAQQGTTGVYTATYTLGTYSPGAKAKFVATVPSETSNYNANTVGTTSGDVEILDKYTPTVTLAASKTEITYGESVTLTATVGKNGQTSPLAGTVQFLDITGENIALGDPVPIDSDGKVTITLGKETLTGPSGVARLIRAKFIPESGSDYKINFSTTVPVAVQAAYLNGAVTIDGTPKYGETLTANTSKLSGVAGDTLGEFDYLWRSTTGTIGTEKTYTIKETDIGKGISVRVTPKSGNYNQVLSATVTPTKADSTLTVTGDLTKTYDGAAVSAPATNQTGSTGAVTFEWYSGDVKLDSAPTDVGLYTVKAILAADSTHEGATDTTSFSITPKATTPTIEAITAVTYDGTAKEPALTVKDGSATLAVSDYTAVYSDNINAGTGKVAVTLKGNYSGRAKASFTINKAALTVTGGTVTSKQWDGNTTAAVTELTFNGLVNGETLAITTDYTAGTPVYNSADAGTDKTVSGTAALESNAKTSNYTLTGAYSITNQTIAKKTGIAAPTYAAMDNTGTTKSFTFNTVSGYDTVTDYEWKLDTDADSAWASVTANPITFRNRAGKMQVRVKGTTNYEAGAILTHSTAFTATLEGSVSIDGTATYGETLTATPAGTQTGVVLSYEWKSGTTVLQAKSASDTYKIAGAAVGKTITVEVTATSYTGSLTDTTASVAKKNLTVTAAAQNKEYDGGTNATVSFTFGSGEVISGDTLTATATSTFANKNVGTDKTVNITDFALGGASKDYYTVTTSPTTATANITAKALTVSDGTLAITKAYDTTTTFTTSTGSLGLTGVLGGETVGVKIDSYGAAADANVGTKTLSLGISLGGADKDNYTVTSPYSFTKASITAKEIVATIEPIDAVTYDGTAKEPALTVKDSSTPLAASDYTAIYSDNTNAGTGKVAVRLKGNYSGSANATFTINKAAAPTVAAPANLPMVKGLQRAYTFDLSTLAMPQNAGTKTYAVARPSDASLFTANPTVDVDGKTLNFTSANITTAGGTSTVVVTITSGNYADTTVTLTFEITDKTPVAISGISVADRAYNGTAIAYTGTPIAKDDKTTVTVSDYTYAWSTADGTALSEAPKNAGNYKLTVSVKASDTQYIGSVDVPFTISKAALTIKADNQTILIGASKPTYTATPNGLVSGETITGVTFSDNALDTNTKGSFIITPTGGTISGGGNENYSITYEPGTLTINIDVSAIDTAIGSANTEKGKVIISDQPASSVENGKKFVTTAEMKALTDAIDTATAAKSTVNTANEAQAAAEALDSAVATFVDAIKTGTYTAPSGGGGGGGGGSTPTPPVTPEIPTTPTTTESNVNSKTDKDGNATAAVADKDITNAIDKAQKEAKKNGTEKNGIAITLNVKTDKNATTLGVTLSQKSVSALIAANVTQVTVNNGLSTITLDLAALNALKGGDVVLTITKMDVKTLSAEAQNAIGSRPVFRFGATVGGKAVSDFKGGRVGLQMPYTRSTTEQVGNLCAVYVDGNGKLTWLENSSYDSLTGTLLTSTTHFSVFGVGYKATTAKFTDVGTHWAKNDIDFVVARGLLSGTSNTTFAPDTSMTRGMFVTALGRLAGVDTKKYQSTQFTDVAATAYYSPYVAWASANNIVNGTSDTTFSPDKAISRQEMAVMLVNYSKTIGYKLPSVHAKVTFTDASSIASWAKDAVGQMQMAGILMGKSGNRFDPTATATRAEVSAMLRRYVELVVSTETAEGWAMNESGQWMYIQDGKRITGKKSIDGTAYTFDQYGVTTALPPERKYGTHIVQRGESFWGIAWKYKVSMFELAKVNGKTIFSVIYAGDELKIPQK